MLNKTRVTYWAKEIVITVLLLFVVANVISYLRAPELPDQTLSKISTILTNEELYSTLDDEGKPLLVHFWATWCPTCKLEAGNIQSISEHFSVLSIAVKSGSDSEINNYLKAHDLDFKVINDQHGILSERFSVGVFPTSFIYNKEGELSFTEVGYTSTLSLYLKMWWAGL